MPGRVAQRWVRALLWIGLSCSGCLATAVFLGRLLPLPTVYVATAKLEHFARHRDEYTTVFIGSSRVYRGISPEVFDETLAEQGIRSKSFNFSLPGMRIAERAYILGRVLEARPRRLELVVLEFDTLQRIERENRTTPRLLYWHDLPTTLMALEMAWTGSRQEGLSLPETLGQQVDHLVPFLLRTLNIGRLQRLPVEGISGVVRTRNSDLELGSRQDGYVSLEEMGTAHRRRKTFLETLEEYQQLLHRLSQPTSNTTLDEQAIRLARTLKRRAADKGVQIVFLLPPDDKRLVAVERSLESADDLLFLSFQDPSRYPDLFAPEARYDQGHLSESGAARFSRLLAEQLAAEVSMGAGEQ